MKQTWRTKGVAAKQTPRKSQGKLPQRPAKGSANCPTTCPTKLQWRVPTDGYTTGPIFPTTRVWPSVATKRVRRLRPSSGKGRTPTTRCTILQYPIFRASTTTFSEGRGPYQLAGKPTQYSAQAPSHTQPVRAEPDEQLGKNAASALVAKSSSTEFSPAIHITICADEPWRCYCSAGMVSEQTKTIV